MAQHSSGIIIPKIRNQIEGCNMARDKETSEFKPLRRDKEHPENGSMIGIVASSCCDLVFFDDVTEEERLELTNGYAERLKKLLSNEGYSPYLPEDTFAPYLKGRSIANTVEERARHLINMLNNPNIEAIIQVDGGITALEVAHMLDQYDRNWEGVEGKITDAWIKKHPGQTLPDDFFTPRLQTDWYTDLNGKEHGLPQRGIPFIGFSDISFLHNMLGQRGVVRSYYANTLCILDCPRATSATDSISKLNPITTYRGLVSGNNEPMPEGTLPIYATLLEHILSTSGLPFQFHLDSPSLLAIETVRSTEDSGKILLEAKERGLLNNVKGIIIGQVRDDECHTIDPNKLNDNSSLRKFINQSEIPVLFTDEKDTFGHGRNSIITKPFANFAPATLTADGNGTVTLSIEGHAPQETLERLFANRISIPLLEHMDPKESKEISGTLEKRTGKSSDLPSMDAVVLDSGELHAIVSSHQRLNVQDKALIMCSGDRNALIGASISGNLEGTKAVIVAIPPEKPVTLCDALSGIIDPYVTWKQDGNSVSSEQQKVRVPFVRKTLEKAGFGDIVVDEKPSENDQKVIVQMTLTSEQQKNIMEAPRPYSERSSWLEIMDDFGERYLGNTPLYILEDDALSQTKGIYQSYVSIQNGIISSVPQEQNLNALDLAEQKKSAKTEETWVQKMAARQVPGKSKELY